MLVDVLVTMRCILYAPFHIINCIIYVAPIVRALNIYAIYQFQVSTTRQVQDTDPQTVTRRQFHALASGLFSGDFLHLHRQSVASARGFKDPFWGACRLFCTPLRNPKHPHLNSQTPLN